jgi:hypothetical protein
MKSPKNIGFKKRPETRKGVAYLILASEMKNVIRLSVVYDREQLREVPNIASIEPHREWFRWLWFPPVLDSDNGNSLPE